MKTLKEIEFALLEIDFIKTMEKRFKQRVEFEIRMGAQSDHFKIVKGRANRKLMKGAEAFIQSLGHPESKTHKKTLVGIPALEKYLTGNELEQFIRFIEHPDGEEKLVGKTAKGEPLSFRDTAFENFN